MMGWFTKIEHAVAGKLQEAFTDAKKLSADAINDVAEAEQKLAEAKQRAAKFSKAAHLAALAAATRAQAETSALIEAAREAEQLANYHAGLTDTSTQQQ
jgi:hypothetical protein